MNTKPDVAPCRVLVVDDNALNVMLVEALLTPAGYTVAAAADAREALAAMADFKPQLVLLDIELPDADGLTLAGQLRASVNGPLRVVIMSAHGEAEIGASVRAAGCDGYVAKPIDPITFCELVHGYLT